MKFSIEFNVIQRYRYLSIDVRPITCENSFEGLLETVDAGLGRASLCAGQHSDRPIIIGTHLAAVLDKFGDDSE